MLLRVLSRVLRIMFAIGRSQGAVQGAVQGCCSGCSGSCLPLGGVRVLCRGAVQGAPDHACHWGVTEKLTRKGIARNSVWLDLRFPLR